MIKLKKMVIFLVALMSIVIIITALNIIYFGQTARPQKSDCIIILGCKVYGTTPSPFLIWRTEEGLKLYKQGYGKYIIVSGGMGSGENISEAAAMKTYLISKGVEASRILIEDKSASTIANLINSKYIMQENKLKTAVIVSNKYHLKRASLMAEHEGISATYSGVFVTPYKYDEFIGYVREIPALVKYYLVKVYLKIPQI